MRYNRMKKEQPNKAVVNLMCPNLRCRKILVVPNAARGQRVRCSYCGILLKVPQKKQNLLTTTDYNKKTPGLNSPESPEESPQIDDS